MGNTLAHTLGRPRPRLGWSCSPSCWLLSLPGSPVPCAWPMCTDASGCEAAGACAAAMEAAMQLVGASAPPPPPAGIVDPPTSPLPLGAMAELLTAVTLSLSTSVSACMPDSGSSLRFLAGVALARGLVWSAGLVCSSCSDWLRPGSGFHSIASVHACIHQLLASDSVARPGAIASGTPSSQAGARSPCLITARAGVFEAALSTSDIPPAPGLPAVCDRAL